MPRSKSNLKPDEWYELVKEGQRYAEELCGGSRWKDFLAYFRADYEDSVTYFYNLIYTHISTLRPAIYFRDPRILITPWKTFGPDPDPVRRIGAQVLESIDNILISEAKLKQVMKDSIVDACLFGRGIIKLGYSFEHVMPQVGDLSELNKAKDGEKTEFDTTIRNGLPWAARVSPMQFIVPFGTRRMENTPWLCHTVLRRTEDVKNSSYYKNLDNIDGTHLDLLKDWVQRTYKDMTLKDDWTELHEIHSLREGKTMTYVPSASSDRPWIKEPEEDLYLKLMGGYNFESLSFNDDPDFFWSVPDARQLEPQQVEMNAAREQAVAHRAISLLKFLYQTGTFDKNGKAALDKFLKGNVGAAIECVGDPSKIIQFQPHIPQDLAIWPEHIRKDSREVMGVGSNQMGAEGGGRKTATEVQAIQLGHDMRTAERRDIVGECIGRIVTKWNSLVKAYWTTEDVVPIVGAEGAIYWLRFKNEDFKGSYKVKVDTDSMSPATLAMRRNEMLQVLQSGTNIPGFGIDAVFRQLLSSYDWADVPNILPQASAAPMGMQDFMTAQAGLSQGAKESGVRNAGMALARRAPSTGMEQ